MNPSKFKTEQEQFWAKEYAQEYIKKNESFDKELGIAAWRIMLHKAHNIGIYLECGCNIGRNLLFLDAVLPDSRKSIIEISQSAFSFAVSRFSIDGAYNGPILESTFDRGSFDLVFTMGVLIHIHPDDLLSNMQKMFDYSRRYVLMGEYFNRTPVMLAYQGQQNKLFKRDFGKLFMENFDVGLVDYGFLWGHIYDRAGFDDITWWLFEKN